MDSAKDSATNSGKISSFMSQISNRVRTISNSSDKGSNFGSDSKTSDNYFYIILVSAHVDINQITADEMSQMYLNNKTYLTLTKRHRSAICTFPHSRVGIGNRIR
uniref:Uncharacterized protein n=1 Tax=Megaselia scalaris TaxID=36166 RepID=T1GJX6_MEGSC